MIGRIPITDVQPAVGCGRWPAKAVVGETFTVTATVFREGHDAVNANVVLNGPKNRRGPWTPMHPVGAGLDRWGVRGPIFILGAAVAFALAVRPLGLAVAGPLVIVISAMASRETRLVEMLIFGTIITAFCLLLFKFALNLPIPVAPWLVGY